MQRSRRRLPHRPDQTPKVEANLRVEFASTQRSLAPLAIGAFADFEAARSWLRLFSALLLLVYMNRAIASNRRLLTVLVTADK